MVEQIASLAPDMFGAKSFLSVEAALPYQDVDKVLEVDFVGCGSIGIV